MNIILTIDTTNNKEMVAGLIVDGKKDIRTKTLDTRKAQVVLPLVKELLEEHQLELTDITSIEVNPGPGSFTGVRVGLTIANTLGYLLKVPVNNKNIGDVVEAKYQE